MNICQAFELSQKVIIQKISATEANKFMLLISKDHKNCYPFQNFKKGLFQTLSETPMFSELPAVAENLIGR